jgi:leucyl aminopeptidase
LQNIIEANFSARTLVNEPLSYLTAEKYSQEIEKIGKKAKFKTTILDKGQIETLKMAGVLAVNKGSFFPPTFNILEYKPKDAINKAPIILVGKGVVYDTGGMSIKTGNGMETMKCDMAGSAAVVGAFQAVAKNKLPIYIVGLIPAVENRINEHAIVPGDIITYNNSTSVEVLNTDAEGRLILADALLYAQKYNPMLVIDLATLTGSAMRAIGTHGIVYMGNAERKTKKSIEKSGLKLSERLVEFPLWFEYEEDLKSSIADINNLGGPTAGAIIGGMFLKHFVDYPWLHLDIAAPAYNSSELNYRGTGGSAVGVRLIYSFLKKEIQRWQNEAIESESE